MMLLQLQGVLPAKKLNQPNRHIVLNRARAQIESQRHADRQRSLREEERRQAEFYLVVAIAAPVSGCYEGFCCSFVMKLQAKAFPCIAMQTRRNHQERFPGFSPGRCREIGMKAAETR